MNRTISAATLPNDNEAIKRRLKDQFLQPICKIFKERVKLDHQSFTLHEEAQIFLESYLIDKLLLLCALPLPHKEVDVDARSEKLFGNHADTVVALVRGSNGSHASTSTLTSVNGAYESSSGTLSTSTVAGSATTKSNKKQRSSTLLPCNFVHNLLKDGLAPHKIEHAISLRFCVVLENLLTEILRLVIIYMKQISLNDYRLTTIERCDVEVVINTYFEESTCDKPVSGGDDCFVEFPNDYSNAVKELVHLENIYQRQLDIIIKLFRAPFEECFPRSADIHTIFSRIDALHECTSLLHSALEDSQEVMEKPLIGACFYDLAESEAFSCYVQYAKDVLKPRCVERLYALLDNDHLRCNLKTLCDKIQCVAASSSTLKSGSTWSINTTMTFTLPSSSSSRRHRSAASISLDTCASSPAGSGALSPTCSAFNAQPCDAECCAALKLESASSHDHFRTAATSSTSALERVYVTGSTISLAASVAASTNLGAAREPSMERQPLLNAARHLLPYLLLVPVFHFCHYITILQRFLQLSADGDEDSDDRVDLEQDLSMLMRDHNLVERSLNASYTSLASSLSAMAPRTWLFKRFFFRNRTSNASVNARLNRGKLSQLHESVMKFKESMDALALKTWNEFIHEGTLFQKYDRSRFTERYVFLFDTMLLVCKSLQRSGLSSATTNKQFEYKLKKLVPLQHDRCVVIDILSVERHDDEERHLIGLEFKDRDGLKSMLTLATRTSQEKKDWIATFITLQYWTTWEHYLDVNNPILNIPLDVMPFSVEEYAFAEADNESNIEFDENAENNSNGNPIVVKATLNKLLERITYPTHMDIKLMDNFLMTFRDFATPQQLLKKLIDRFNIPEVTEQSFKAWWINYQHAAAVNNDEFQREAVEWLRRFRKVTLKPIQLRVLNMMKKWIENYYSDFEHDAPLTLQLEQFLESEACQSREMRLHCCNITKALRRHQEGRQKVVSCPEPNQDGYRLILWHVARAEDADKFSLMNLHPLELGRQITLMMHELYRRINSSELVTGAWNKGDRWRLAPNVMRFIRFANKLPWWCEVCICQASNLEERQQVFLRVYELLMVFDKLQNYAAAMSLVAVFGASSTQQIRLPHTWWVLKDGDEDKFLSRMRELVGDGRGTKFQQELVRNITAPCVPPLGPVLTHITMLLQQKSDRADANQVTATRLLDVANMRKLATVITDLLQFHSPYPFQAQKEIQDFLFNLDPVRMLDAEYNSDATQDIQDFIDDKLYTISLEIEPRDCALEDLPKGKSMYTSAELKSPGINVHAAKNIRGAGTATNRHSVIANGGSVLAGARGFSSTNISRSNSPPASPRLPSPVPPVATSVTSPALTTTSVIATISNTSSSVSSSTLVGSKSAILRQYVHGHSKSDSDVMSSASPPPLPPRRDRPDVPRLPPRHRYGSSMSGSITIGTPPPLHPRSTRRQQSSTPPPHYSYSSRVVSPQQRTLMHMTTHQVQQVKPAATSSPAAALEVSNQQQHL